MLNGYAADMTISNNVLETNSGIYGGGIRVGHPNVTVPDNQDNLLYEDAMNYNVHIHHNNISKNGNSNGNGGGITLHPGSDNYVVEKNWVCGNFSKGHGGGIGQFGMADNGLIQDNLITFNETFNQMPGTAPSGAGLYIGGQPALQPTAEGLLLSPGTGNVVVDSNIIRGNLAGAGDGGGIFLQAVNGMDIYDNVNKIEDWYQVSLFNNMVTNNVAGVAGAVTLSDAAKVVIQHNTIANNDSTATGSQAFLPASPNLSVPQPAGVVSRVYSGDMVVLLRDLVTDKAAPNHNYPDPLLQANIVLQNRSFFWLNSTPNATLGTATVSGIYPANCVVDPINLVLLSCDATSVSLVSDYTWDFAVMKGVVTADPTFELSSSFSLLTANAGNSENVDNVLVSYDPYADLLNPIEPVFVNSYFNVPKETLLQNEFKTLQTAGAFDEGGNFIQVAYDPLTRLDLVDGGFYDYHLAAGSPALNVGQDVIVPPLDIDDQARIPATDAGADEL